MEAWNIRMPWHRILSIDIGASKVFMAMEPSHFPNLHRGRKTPMLSPDSISKTWQNNNSSIYLPFIHFTQVSLPFLFPAGKVGMTQTVSSRSHTCNSITLITFVKFHCFWHVRCFFHFLSEWRRKEFMSDTPNKINIPPPFQSALSLRDEFL